MIPTALLRTLFLWLSCSYGLLGISEAIGTPFRPQNDDEILEYLPPASGQESRLQALRKKLKKDPKQLELALQIANGYLQLGYQQADPRYNGYAESTLRPWWQQPHPPLSVLLLRARLYERQHNFSAALADLDQVLVRSPGQTQALLSRAIILQVLGRFPEAQHNCLQLFAKASRLSASACLSSTTSLMGKAAQSYQLLGNALAQNTDAKPAIQQWVLGLLAEMAVRLGNVQQAEQHYQAALAIALRDPYTLGAFADLLLDLGRNQEVIALLAKEERIDALLLRRTLAEVRVGHLASEAHIARLQRSFEAAQQRGNQTHLREQARFTLHLLQQAKPALQMAKQNWQIQKQPQDARIYMEAALATKAHAQLQALRAWLHASGLEDQRLAPLFAVQTNLP